MTPFDAFTKKRDYLVCVDSDGCAMDTMDIKHIRCFGPCMVTEWNLQKWQDEILFRWNQINLYSMTRGINRFRGLAMALHEISAKYTKIDGIDALVSWAEEANELSNRSVSEMYQKTGNDVFRKALSWSEHVNQSINQLSDEDKKPFIGVKEGLQYASERADVSVVSSANRDAVEEEWVKYGLKEHVDLLLCQDAGSKAHCISELLKKGYEKDHILMVGDAPGDLQAAETNSVYYYPILVRHENESWAGIPAAVDALINGTYETMGTALRQKFLDNLKEE